MLLDLPDFSLWPATKRRRIKNNGIITALPAGLSFHKLVGIIENPTERRLLQVRQFLVRFGPGKRWLRRIHMRDRKASPGSHKTCYTRIAKQVEQMQGSSAYLPGLFLYPGPVCGLFWEHPDMFGHIGTFGQQGQAVK